MIGAGFGWLLLILIILFGAFFGHSGEVLVMDCYSCLDFTLREKQQGMRTKFCSKD